MFGIIRQCHHQLGDSYENMVIAALVQAQLRGYTDAALIRSAVGRCSLRVLREESAEVVAARGGSLLACTRATESATGAAFARTAILVGRPQNREALTEVGRLFGRIAHLLDAVDVLADDLNDGKWNPLTATGTTTNEVRRLCTDAALGIELALAEVEFTEARLIHKLLTEDLRRSVDRTFHPAMMGRGRRDACGVACRDC